jgi:hypothetical protein
MESNQINRKLIVRYVPRVQLVLTVNVINVQTESNQIKRKLNVRYVLIVMLVLTVDVINVLMEKNQIEKKLVVFLVHLAHGGWEEHVQHV